MITFPGKFIVLGSLERGLSVNLIFWALLQADINIGCYKTIKGAPVAGKLQPQDFASVFVCFSKRRPKALHQVAFSALNSLTDSVILWQPRKMFVFTAVLLLPKTAEIEPSFN